MSYRWAATARGRRLEHRMGDDLDTVALDPGLFELFPSSLGVDHDPVDSSADGHPGAAAVLAPAEQVVRSKDRRAAERAQPAQVTLGQREPLDVHHVRRKRVEAAAEPPHARRVLGSLHQPVRRRAGRQTPEAAADREEELLARIALGRRRLPVGKPRRQHRDLVPTARESCGEAMVIRRRVARQVEQGDAHTTSV